MLIESTCSFGQYTSQQPVPTLANRVCSPVTNCTANETQEQAPTATTDRSCSKYISSGLSSSQIAGIVVAALLFFVLSGVGFVVLGRWLGARDRKLIEEAEMQLMAVQEESNESRATVRRILAAWFIPADHLTYTRKLAEGNGVLCKSFFSLKQLKCSVVNLSAIVVAFVFYAYILALGISQHADCLC
jgi:hypothetical protein